MIGHLRIYSCTNIIANDYKLGISFFIYTSVEVITCPNVYTANTSRDDGIFVDQIMLIFHVGMKETI